MKKFWLISLLAILSLGPSLSYAQSKSSLKPFHYHNQKDTVYTSPMCICEKDEDKGVLPPPQDKKDTNLIYDGQTPAYQVDSNGFDVIVLDTIQSAPPCNCPRIPNIFEAEQPQMNHAIGGLIAPWSYTLIYDRDLTFSIGGTLGASEDLYNTLYRIQATKMNQPFYEDPSYFGLRIGYSTINGRIQVEDEEREESKIRVDAEHLMLSGLYGWWWQWEVGFFVLAQIAYGIPVIDDVQFSNPRGIREDQYKKERDFWNNSINFLARIQGTGLSVGWTF